MSIHNFINKIKSKTDIDKITIVYLSIIILVGIGSFGLGRISVNSGIETKGGVDINQINNLLGYQDMSTVNKNTITQTQSLEKRYVASKNGKMYYSVECSGAKRIKTENQIWFSTKEEAEKSGYSLSLTCK